MNKLKSAVAVAACLAGSAVFAEATSDWTVTWDDANCLTGSVACAHNSFVLNVTRTSSYGGFGLRVGWAMGNGVKSVDAVATYLDMRGTITGADLRADPATNAVWTFSHLRGSCFRPNNGSGTATPAQWILGLRTPGTLVSDGWSDVFHIDTTPNPQRTKEIIVDEPNFTGNIGGWGLNSVGGLTNLVFRVPKATTMTDPIAHGATGWKTDIGVWWDLSGVKYVGNTSATAVPAWGSMSSGYYNLKGILRLPSLIHIAAGPTDNGSGFRCSMGEVELGLNGNLTHLACHSFKDCNKLTNVVIGTALGKTLTICTNAFRCANLKTIYFNGDKPTFKSAYHATSPCFGLSSTPEGQITFYVRDVPSWAEVLAEADANGGYVAGSTLHTANRQRVVRYSGLNKVTVELQDPRFADVYHETVSMTPTDGREGDYHYGAITLTATCAEPDDAATNPRRAKFLRWDGVPVALERQNPLTYTPTKSATVRAVFAHDWVMTTDAEPNRTMDNGIWRVCCYKRDEAKAWLGLGRASNVTGHGSLFPPTPELRKGGGDLNLNGDVWEPAEGGTWKKWTVSHACSSAPWVYDSKVVCHNPDVYYAHGEYEKLITRLTLPETIVAWPGEIHNCNSWDNSDTHKWRITELFAICPQVTGGTLLPFTIGGVSQLSRLVIRVPGLKTIGAAGPYGIAWAGTTFSKTDFDEWDLSGVTTVAINAFRCASAMNAKGTLRLPNAENVGSNAFVQLKSAQGLVLGTNGLKLKTLDEFACSGMSALTNLEIGAKSLALGGKLAAASVFNNANLKTVHLPGRALSTEAVDAILKAIPESATTKQVTIYASPFNHWDRLATVPTADEEVVKPADCFGVYREGLRKAWFVTERSPYEPQGAVLLLR